MKRNGSNKNYWVADKIEMVIYSATKSIEITTVTICTATELKSASGVRKYAATQFTFITTFKNYATTIRKRITAW
jgi:hypothetical protein